MKPPATPEIRLRAVEMRAEGKVYHEIAQELGYSISTVGQWFADPEVTRRRRARYGGSCADCGKPTDGSRGPGKGSKRCQLCAHIYAHAQAKWTQETIIAKIQEWAELYGRRPTAGDWSPGQAKRAGHHERLERYLAGDWPSAMIVQRVFGKNAWTKAAAAAGVDLDLRVGASRDWAWDKPRHKEPGERARKAHREVVDCEALLAQGMRPAHVDQIVGCYKGKARQVQQKMEREGRSSTKPPKPPPLSKPRSSQRSTTSLLERVDVLEKRGLLS